MDNAARRYILTPAWSFRRWKKLPYAVQSLYYPKTEFFGEADWKLQGNVIGLNFMLFDQNGEAIAAIGQKMISIHNRCSIDLYQPKHEKIVVAIVIQLQKMLTARRENNS